VPCAIYTALLIMLAYSSATYRVLALLVVSFSIADLNVNAANVAI
jgi:hypothetical protein